MATRRARENSVASELRRLVAARNSSEEALHQFVVDNPVVLRRFGWQIVSKPKFGADYAADFLVRSIGNGLYHHFIEIERASHRLFTRAGLVSQALSRAQHQIRSWRAWLGDFRNYGQAVSEDGDPSFHIVIGRRADLSAIDRRRLKELNHGLLRCSVITWDTLIDEIALLSETAVQEGNELLVYSDTEFRAAHGRTLG